MAEVLVKEATLAARAYNTNITLVILPDNAGFGAANNAAANFARSARILIVNPDVFPRNNDWARQHCALIEGLPAEQVSFFGVPLYYDDGSIMHAGMFVESDLGILIAGDAIVSRRMLRVEHHGKGAPPKTAALLASRPVTAVTGAFMSIRRDLYESLGGFSEDYLFGHYEDADLCLKSFVAGNRVWLHNIPFWHLEGKGSNRQLVHEGGSMVNRWHFTKVWGALIFGGLDGPDPELLKSSGTVGHMP